MAENEKNEAIGENAGKADIGEKKPDFADASTSDFIYSAKGNGIEGASGTELEMPSLDSFGIPDESEADKAKEEKAAVKGSKKYGKKRRFDAHRIFQLAAGVALIIGIILIVNVAIKPMIKYSDASAALDEGEYEEAIRLFTELDGYRDSKTLLAQAQMMFDFNRGYDITGKSDEMTAENIESSYLRAKSYITNKKYDKAAQILRILGNYKDCTELLEGVKYYGLKIGDSLSFGEWEQDGNQSNGFETLEWTVASVEDDSIVLICDNVIECRAYSDDGADSWKDSTLRKFLTGEFYERAFSTEEKNELLAKKLVTEVNPEYETSSGSATVDSVFVLSIEEYKSCMTKLGNKKRGTPTPYAVAKGCHEYKKTVKNSETGKNETFVGTWCWLRSAGFTKGYAAVCYADGDISYGGQDTAVKLGVRPAVRIALKEPEFEENK